MPTFVPPPGKSRRTTRSSAPATTGWSARCEQAVDWGIAASILLIPLMLGGIKPVAQLFLVVLAVLTASAWLLAQAGAASPRWRWLGAEPLILAAVALLVVQITPLPGDWINRISPELSGLLPLWSSAARDGQFADWSTISLAPADSLSGLVTFGAYALMFLVTAQRVRSIDDVRRILNGIALATACQAVFGLAQFFFSNGRFFWVHIEPAVSTANELHGSFVNRNHAAHFLALGVGPLLRLALGGAAGPSRSASRFAARSAAHRSPLLKAAAWIGLVCVVLACALTMSRGGLLALGASALVFVLVSQRRGARAAGLLPLTALLVGGVAAAMFLPGADRIEQRLASLTSLDLDQLDQAHGRRRIWDAVADGIADFPVLGTGLGTHRYVYPLYFDHPDQQVEYNTADSGYLELTLETGLAGLLLAITALALLVARSLHAAADGDVDKVACAAAIAAGVAASALHSVLETPWFMPGCMMLLIPLAACALAHWRTAERDRNLGGIPLPRPLCAIAGLLLPCCLLTAVPVKQNLIRNAICRRALDPLTTDAQEFDASSLDTEEWRRQLDLVSQSAATNPRVHLGLAGQYLQLFEQLQKGGSNPLTLTEIRETVTTGRFESPAELQEWLFRAFEGRADCLLAARDHARRAVELCPLEGRAYVYLSELAFLDLRSVDDRRRLLEQAARVRPYDPHVMFAAGQLEWQSGDLPGALAHWKSAYHRSRAWESTVTDALISILPADEFLAEFQPDWTALRLLRHRLKGTSHPGYTLILKQLADATVLEAQSAAAEESAALWLEAAQEFEELQESGRAVSCALAAVAAQPGLYEAHFKAGRALLDNNRHSEAVEEFRWCQRRNADDQKVAGLLAQAIRAEIRSVDPAGRSSPTTLSRPLMSDSVIQTAGVETQDSSAGEPGRIPHRAAVTQADYRPPPRKD